jgi:DNA-directed RNA polymerase specialized sigma24 family protein
MAESPSFDDFVARVGDFKAFMSRVRAGDKDAERQLVQAFESSIRRAARPKLEKGRLQSLLDSVDISQAVLNSFFAAVKEQDKEFAKPLDLLRFLLAMSRNKVVTHGRKNKKQVRGGLPEESRLAARGSSPSSLVANQEMLDVIKKQLTPEEGQLAQMRFEGHGFKEIASRMGGTADARKHQFHRALDRVKQRLGREQGDE